MTAQVRWNWARGEEKGDIDYFDNTGETPGADINVSWEDVLTRDEIIIGLTVIEQRVLETPWPPAP